MNANANSHCERRCPAGHCLLRGLAIATIAATAVAAPPLLAQTTGYPLKPIRVIVPYPAGGPTEISLRLIAPRLAEGLGQQIIIDNRGGAGTRIGTEAVARAPRDGYTLLFNSNSHTASALLFKKLPYDVTTDFTPITQVDITSGNLLVVHPSLPVRTAKDLIALARARPGQLNYASGGIGSPPHITAALFAAMSGIQLNHVPYKGGMLGLTDVLGGRIEVMFVGPSQGVPYIKAERLRALGTAGPRRLPTLPGLPTIHEAGVNGYNMSSWHGLWFPAGVPVELVRRLQTEIAKVLAVTEIIKSFEEIFLFPVGNTPDQFSEFIRKDLALQATIMKTIGIEPE